MLQCIGRAGGGKQPPRRARTSAGSRTAAIDWALTVRTSALPSAAAVAAGARVSGQRRHFWSYVQTCAQPCFFLKGIFFVDQRLQRVVKQEIAGGTAMSSWRCDNGNGNDGVEMRQRQRQ